MAGPGGNELFSNSTLQGQTAVAAHFSSEQLLLFAFARHNMWTCVTTAVNHSSDWGSNSSISCRSLSTRLYDSTGADHFTSTSLYDSTVADHLPSTSAHHCSKLHCQHQVAAASVSWSRRPGAPSNFNSHPTALFTTKASLNWWHQKWFPSYTEQDTGNESPYDLYKIWSDRELYNQLRSPGGVRRQWIIVNFHQS